MRVAAGLQTADMKSILVRKQEGIHVAAGEARSSPSRQHCNLLCGEHFSRRYAPIVDTLQPSNRKKCRSLMPAVVRSNAL